MANQLNDTDRLNMNAYFGFLLDAHNKGAFSKDQAVAALAAVVDALDRQDYQRAKAVFEQGRKLILCEATALTLRSDQPSTP